MRYKVYDTIKKKFITNDSDLILKPNGRLALNDYGDEVGVPHCIALFFRQIQMITILMSLAEFTTLGVVGRQMAVIAASVPTLVARFVAYGRP